MKGIIFSGWSRTILYPLKKTEYSEYLLELVKEGIRNV